MVHGLLNLMLVLNLMGMLVFDTPLLQAPPPPLIWHAGEKEIASTKKEMKRKSSPSLLWVFGFDPRQLASVGVAGLCAPNGH